MTFRAFSIGFSAALLALACGSDDNNPGGGGDDVILPPPPSGDNDCDTNPYAQDCGDDTNTVPVNPDEPAVDQPPVTVTDPGAIELANVQAILAENCGGCHGPGLLPALVQGGMNYITDLDRLAEEGKITPLNSGDSTIINYMRQGIMPPGALPKVPNAEIQQVADYIDNPDYWQDVVAPGDCADSGQQVDFDDLFEIINNDLSGEDADDQVNYRYLVLTNRYNAGICNDTSLDRDRQALVKMVNMLSISPSIEEPLDVDGEGLVYRVDLRDYEWDRAISINGENFNDVWEAVAANNIYAVPFLGDEADDAVADTGTAFPFQFADSFADVATVGNAYYAIIDVDVAQTLDDFVLNVLEIDQVANLDEEELIRAGTSDSDLSRQDMVAERHEIEARNGAYWQRFDFADDQNESIYEDPFNFQEAGREAIFTLENGLFGYIIADADGVILEDSDILLDFNQNNFRVTTAVSCSNCHANGLIAFEDQVREFTLANAIALELDAVEREAIEDVYPSAQVFAAQIASDTDQFYKNALERANLPVTGPDPVSRVFFRFDLDMNLNDAAGDLGVTPDFLANNIRELNPAVQVLDSGTQDRDDFTQFYVDSLCRLSIVLDNAPDPVVCQAAADALLL